MFVDDIARLLDNHTRPLDSGPTQRCEHLKCIPEFDAKAAKGMRDDEIRKKWPRFSGVCPECREQVIVYASFDHYIMGDY